MGVAILALGALGCGRIGFDAPQPEGGDAGEAGHLHTTLGASGTRIVLEARQPGSSSFGEPHALAELNTDAAEGDPWVSADGRTILFRRSSADGSDLYEARR